MSRLYAALLAAMLLVTSCVPALARDGTRAHARTALTTFRLQVSGQSSPGTTYWVAYGPLAGRFGLVRLHQVEPSLQIASLVLPLRGRTVYAFLAGHGTIHTRAGAAPGDPVVVIRKIGPVDAAAAGGLTVHWEAPVG